ncbi:MAG: anaerobic sulfatase maturase [Bacteroidales bacterium]|jgi:uncharacterized protein
MDKKGFLTLDDALKIQGPRSFMAMTKPVGSKCNLDCTYCYYLDKERFYGSKQEPFSEEMLEIYIRDYIEANQVPEITFVWHGGEPLMAGIDYYKSVIKFQKKHNYLNKKINNSIQTNGTLLNEEWCKFFKRNNFLVGVSVDGPKDIHDSYRKDKSGFSSFTRTMKGIELLKTYKVEFNTLTVVNNLSEGRGREIYIFLKSIGSHYMQFLPAVDYIEQTEENKRPIIVSPDLSDKATLASWSVSAQGYGQFLIDIFDYWVRNDVGTYFVQLFDLTLGSWYGVNSAVCAYAQTCGDNVAVEHNGDVFSCDHFVYPAHLIGNIKSRPLKEIIGSDAQIQFGINKRNTLSVECLGCQYYFACGGECPKHRHLLTKDGERKFSLCEGIKMFYTHSEPYMRYMVDLLNHEKSPSYVIPWAATINY